jgi:hypothetical protein
MDNPEILITLGTQDAGRRHTKQKHNTENYVERNEIILDPGGPRKRDIFFLVGKNK